MNDANTDSVTPPTSRNSLSVMSYNVRFDNPDVDSYMWRDRRDGVANVIRRHGPDVVGLQEALHGQLDDLRSRLPSYEWLTAGRAGVRNAGEYAAVGYNADRFHAVEESTFWLSDTPDEAGSIGWDARFPRLVRWVRLRERSTGDELVHFNTHFDHEGTTAQLRSAELLGEFVRELAPKTPVVVTGDFNCLESDAPYRYLVGDDVSIGEQPLCDSRYESRSPHYGPATTRTEFDSLVSARKIDYVLVSEDISVASHAICTDTTAEGRYPSDHLPVVTRLVLPSGDDVSTTTASPEVNLQPPP